MICWAVPSSLARMDLESAVGCICDEGPSLPVVGSDRGMISMASGGRKDQVDDQAGQLS